MESATPQKEHKWLEQLIGEWEFEMPAPEGAGVDVFRGRETVRSIGGLWVVLEGKSTMPDGTPTTTIMTLGYDPLKGRYIGSWIGSMMAHQWVYQGQLEANGKVLPLDTEGPAMSGQGIGKYRDIIEFIDPDHRTLSGNTVKPDGTLQNFCTTHYRRVR